MALLRVCQGSSSSTRAQLRYWVLNLWQHSITEESLIVFLSREEGVWNCSVWIVCVFTTHHHGGEAAVVV
jgi:hypothetical protein